MDEVLIQITAGGTKTYYHSNHQGSVIATTNSSGAVLNRYTYGPFGESAALTGTTHGYTGQRYDSETGLYYFKMRQYSPKLGRFLQADPIGMAGGINLYCYCSNSPLISSDSLGLVPINANYDASNLSTSDTSITVDLILRPLRAPGGIGDFFYHSSIRVSNFIRGQLAGVAEYEGYLFPNSIPIPLLPGDDGYLLSRINAGLGNAHLLARLVNPDALAGRVENLYTGPYDGQMLLRIDNAFNEVKQYLDDNFTAYAYDPGIGKYNSNSVVYTILKRAGLLGKVKIDTFSLRGWKEIVIRPGIYGSTNNSPQESSASAQNAGSSGGK